MPLDPAISLAAGQGLPQQQPILGGNPIGSALTMMQIQNAANQNRLFQQTFAARQQMGEIMASAPNTEAGLQQILQSPAAPFAGEFLNSIRAAQQAMVGMQGEQQKQAQSGLEAVMHMLPSVYANPTNGQWQTSMNVATQGLSPYAMQASKGAIESIRQGLMENLPADQNAAAGVVRQRIGALLYSSNMTPDQMYALGGVIRPQVVQTTGAQGQPISQVVGGSPFPQGQGGGMGAVQGGQGAMQGGGAPALNAGVGAAPGSVLGIGPTATQGKYLTDRGTDMAQYQKALDTNVSMGATIQQTIAEARNAMANFIPGGGAETYAKIAQVAQAFGADPKIVDKISNGDLSASQEFNKLMVNTVMGQIREQLSGIGGSRLSQMEFQTFSKNNPNIETDPRAIGKIFDFWTRLYQRDVDEQRSMNQYLGRGGDISQWPATWQHIAAQKGYIVPSVTASGAPILGNQPPETKAQKEATPQLAAPSSGGKKSLQEIFGGVNP